MAVTSQLCERIAGISYENLGVPAIEAARRLVLDGIAVAIAGTEEEAIHILAAHHKEQGGAAQATAIGNGFRLNTVSAAALNGAAMHVLDFEPMWIRPTMRSRPRWPACWRWRRHAKPMGVRS